jgi:hypothetical protein
LWHARMQHLVHAASCETTAKSTSAHASSETNIQPYLATAFCEAVHCALGRPVFTHAHKHTHAHAVSQRVTHGATVTRLNAWLLAPCTHVARTSGMPPSPPLPSTGDTAPTLRDDPSNRAMAIALHLISSRAGLDDAIDVGGSRSANIWRTVRSACTYHPFCTLHECPGAWYKTHPVYAAGWQTCLVVNVMAYRTRTSTPTRPKSSLRR